MKPCLWGGTNEHICLIYSPLNDFISRRGLHHDNNFLFWLARNSGVHGFQLSWAAVASGVRMRVKGKSIRLRRRKCWLTECCLTRIEWDWRLLYCVYSYVVLTKVCTLWGWVVSGGSDLGETLPAIRNCEEVAIHGVDEALLVALRIDHRGILALAAQDARSLDDGLHFLVQVSRTLF